MGRSNFLDALRAFAIISVVLAHYFHTTFPGASIGVSIFFPLSGFLITSALLDQYRIDWDSIWRFWVRRFCRVYPAYIFVALAALAIMGLAENPKFEMFAANFVGFATFTHRPYEFIAMVPGVFWTLFIEFWFYVTIPIAMLLFGRGRRLAWFLVAVAVLSFLAVVDATFLGLHFEKLTHLLPGRSFPWIGQLVYGALAAIATRKTSHIAISNDAFMVVSRCCFVALLLIIVFVANDDRTIVWPIEANVAAVISTFWIYCWSRSSFEIRNGIIPYIGRISYSLYLVHALPVDYAQQTPWLSFGFSSLSRSWGAILVMFAVAVVMERWLERPFRRLGRRVTENNRCEVAMATQPT